MWTLIVNSAFGRGVAAVAAVIFALIGVFFTGRAKGRAVEKRKQTEKNLANLREREKTRDYISKMPADDRRRRLSKWMSDDS